MRIRHAMAAGTAVALLSAATTLMASSTASASVTLTTAAAPVSASVPTAAAGSAAGLLLGLLFVLALAAISFVVRVGTPRRSPARIVTIPTVVASRDFSLVFAD